MKPYGVYVIDLLIRSLYVLLSYALCLIIFFYKIDILFLIEVYPLLSLSSKRFIVTNLTDFIDVIFLLSIFMSTFSIFPLFFFHVTLFFCSSWYSYQLKFYKRLTLIFYKIFVTWYFILHYFFFPVIFNFFTYWEIKEDSSLLRIETETTLISYVIWTLNFKAVFCSFLILLVFITINFLYFIKIKQVYKFIKLNKSIFIFLLTFLSFLVTPPDFFTQLFLVIGNFFICDILFFYICIKLYKSDCMLSKN
nr:preprotein translocase subunit SecY [Phymatolithon calcareum]